MTNEQLKQLKELNDNLANDFKLVEHFENVLTTEPKWSPDIDKIKTVLSVAREFLDDNISRMKEFMKGLDND